MTKIIDVRDLPEEKVKFVQNLVQFFRETAKVDNDTHEEGGETTFSAWPLGVKGKLTREEIYDYL